MQRGLCAACLWFPDLIDRTRGISEYRTFGDPGEALDYTARMYRRDRAEGQEAASPGS